MIECLRERMGGWKQPGKEAAQETSGEGASGDEEVSDLFRSKGEPDGVRGSAFEEEGVHATFALVLNDEGAQDGAEGELGEITAIELPVDIGGAAAAPATEQTEPLPLAIVEAAEKTTGNGVNGTEAPDCDSVRGGVGAEAVEGDEIGFGDGSRGLKGAGELLEGTTAISAQVAASVGAQSGKRRLIRGSEGQAAGE